jgi:protein O-GlcNAc transferase
VTAQNCIEIALEHHRASRWEAAMEAYQVAIRQYPHMPELPFNLASILHATGNWAAAEPLYRQATILKPAFAEAHNNLGDVYKQLGRYADAAMAFEKAIRLRPDYAEAFNNLGSVLQIQGHLEQAITSYRNAVAIKPELFQAFHNLATCFWRAKEFSLALEAAKQSVTLSPDFHDAQLQLGMFLQQTNQLDEAIPAFESAVQLKPDSINALLCLGNAYQLQGRLLQAIPVYEQLLAFDPTHFVACNDLATAYQEINHYGKAREYYERAVALAPDFASAYANLASCCFLQQDFQGSIDSCRKALVMNPTMHRVKMMLVNQLMLQCDWRDVERLSDELIAANDLETDLEAMAPFAFISLAKPTTPEQQLRCARKWSNYLKQKCCHRKVQRLTKVLAKRRIRIGYMSADFRTHAVAFMLPELFEQHDRSDFEVFAYALCGEDESPIRHRLKNGVDVFREMQSFSHRQAAEQIAADQIDILIDLQGYTTHNRSEILEMRPAPIQVSYIGFPGTMGCDFIDYILVDDYVTPPNQQAFYTEKLVHLPGCYQVNDSYHEVSDRQFTRAECGLPDDGFVFCSFNSFAKYTPTMFDCWMRLLRSVPNSVLWCAGQNDRANTNLQREAINRGVPKQRIVFAEQLPIGEHLARHHLADLFLDTYPYNGHATASIAIRMGLPIVTLSGSTLASRVAGSLLRAVDMSSLISTSFEEYETIAMRLATDPQACQATRSQLVKNLKIAKLFDGQDFARKVERAYRKMYALLQSGAAPSSMVIE